MVQAGYDVWPKIRLQSINHRTVRGENDGNFATQRKISLGVNKEYDSRIMASGCQHRSRLATFDRQFGSNQLAMRVSLDGQYSRKGGSKQK
jgi:hypothetical protein